ncbi:MAG: response regulator [Myxococcales bacterium]|nr:MAG: response regulator [Myxococcales bacterium]
MRAMNSEPLSVLLVEDDEQAAAVLESLFAGAGLPIVWRRKGCVAAALKEAREDAPSVVFLSLQLKEADAARILDQWFSSAPDAPVVCLTTPTTLNALPHAFARGATGYLPAGCRDADLARHVLHGAVIARAARQTELRQSLKTLFSISSHAIFVIDPESGKILAANPYARTLYGYLPEELARMSFDELAVESVEAGPVRPKHGRPKKPFRARHTTKSGLVLDVEVTPIMAELPEGPRTVVLVRDLTEERQREEEIQFLQEFNSLILDSLPFAITVKAENHRVTYQNRVSIATFGFLVGKIFSLGLEASESEADGPGRTTARTADLDWKGAPFSVTLLTIRDVRTGESILIELAQDVSSQRRIQNELIQAQRMEAVGNLAGGIAHDFNNLLSGILGYANLIQAVGEENEQVAQYAQIIEETCIRASELTQQLLQFARRKTGGTEVFDLNTIIRYAAKLLRASGKKEIPLAQKLSAKKILVRGEPAQVQQMVVNLGLNTFESMNEGQITIGTHAAASEAGSELAGKGIPEGPWAVIEIHDTGRVIDQESLAALFDAYSPQKVGGGPVGLGLSVAHAIIRAHQGRVLVESDPKRGNVVRIYLPQILEAIEEDTPEPEDLPRGNETVLVVDDEEVIRNLMLTSLSRFGYRVLVATGAEEGLRLYSLFKNDINLIMLDIGLPGMDGTKVYQLIRAINPQARVIFFTGSDSPKGMKMLAKDERVDWIAKPISLKRLTQKMRQALDADATTKNSKSGAEKK